MAAVARCVAARSGYVLPWTIVPTIVDHCTHHRGPLYPPSWTIVPTIVWLDPGLSRPRRPAWRTQRRSCRRGRSKRCYASS